MIWGWIWFYGKGFPEGKLGFMMTQMHEIKINGLEDIIKKIRRDFSR